MYAPNRKCTKPSRVWNTKQSKPGFSISLWELRKSGKKKEKRKLASLSKNRDIKKTPKVDLVEDLPTYGNQLVHTSALSLWVLRKNLHAVLEEYEDKLEEYEDVCGDTKLEDCSL